MLTALGHAHLKLVERVKTFPFLLGVLPAAQVSDVYKQTVSDNFFACEADCYEPGMARIVRTQVADALTLRTDESTLAWIDEIYANMSSHNIRNEDRLGRIRTHQVAAHGQQVSNVTIAAKHVCSEWFAWHRLGVSRYNALLHQISLSHIFCPRCVSHVPLEI
jgi:hypothetical protein